MTTARIHASSILTQPRNPRTSTEAAIKWTTCVRWTNGIRANKDCMRQTKRGKSTPTGDSLWSQIGMLRTVKSWRGLAVPWFTAPSPRSWWPEEQRNSSQDAAETGLILYLTCFKGWNETHSDIIILPDSDDDDDAYRVSFFHVTIHSCPQESLLIAMFVDFSSEVPYSFSDHAQKLTATILLGQGSKISAWCSFCLQTKIVTSILRLSLLVFPWDAYPTREDRSMCRASLEK